MMNSISPLKNFNLAAYTSWHVGGLAEYFYEPINLDDLTVAQNWARERNLPITVLGGGSNVLISDDGVSGLVLSLSKIWKSNLPEILSEILPHDSTNTSSAFSFWISSAAPKTELLKLFLKRKLQPACFLAGLPGQVGGGVIMNAGVSENLIPQEFCSITEAVEILRPDGTLEIIEKSNLRWSYRHCEGWQPGIITRVKISWSGQPSDTILPKVKELNQIRTQKQPLEWPSCGSVFRNPTGDVNANGRSAGRLIEEAGLKGYIKGGAQVSEKHANFIINKINAKASDIKFLINYCQRKVREDFGVELKTEVIFLGQFEN